MTEGTAGMAGDTADVTQAVSWHDGAWWLGTVNVYGVLDWVRWPYPRMLLRCTGCGELSLLAPDQLGSGEAIALEQALPEPDRGQFVTSRAEIARYPDDPPRPPDAHASPIVRGARARTLARRHQPRHR